MLKWLGMLLVVFAATGFGFMMANRYAARPRQIRTLILSLQRLETEIHYALTPLPEALRIIGRQSALPVSRIFTQTAECLEQMNGISVQESWSESVRRIVPQTALRGVERDCLLNLGCSMGITDREDQIKHLRLAVSQLQAEEVQAWEEQRRFEKMWRMLGALTGLLIVIIMY